MKFKILTLVGGISRESLNKKLYNAVKTLAPEALTIETFDISKLPFFSQDIENDPPDIVTEFKERIREADGVLFITPEYNRSFPGVLKNAIDWGSRPYGQNLWNMKPAAVMGATISSVGTFGAQHHLRQCMAYLNMIAMGQPEFYFTAKEGTFRNNVLKDETTIRHIRNFCGAFEQWMQLVGPAPRKAEGLEDAQYTH